MLLATVVAVFVVLLIVGVIRNRRGGGGGAPAMQGGPRPGKSCQFERVDHTSERTLQEYRCDSCGQVAYGRVDTPPAARTCTAKSG